MKRYQHCTSNMRKLIILLTIVAYALAAPATSREEQSAEHAKLPLQRPSPINPDVPSDPKPPERIIKITDPQEISKHKRATDNNHHAQDTITTHQTSDIHSTASGIKLDHVHDDNVVHTPVQPVISHEHIRSKRANKQPADTPSAKPVGSATAATKPFSLSSKPLHSAKPSNAPATAAKTTDNTPKHRQKRDESKVTAAPVATAVPIPLIYKDASKLPAQQQPNVQPQILAGVLPADASTTAVQRRKILAASERHTDISSATPALHIDAKRDIPVPLVPKHTHPEESSKDVAKPDEQPIVAKEEPKPSEDKKTQSESESKSQSELLESSKDKTHKPNLNDNVPIAHETQHHTQLPHALHAHEFHPQHAHIEHKPEVEQQQHEQQHEQQQKQQPEQHKDNASTSTSTSTTEHPVIRHHPVPVAELFARPKANPAN